MNREELLDATKARTGMTKKDLDIALVGFLTEIENAVAGGDKVTLIGFGVFEPHTRKARKGRNPQTGEEIEIAATTVPDFKPGKTFKDKVAGK